MSAVTVADFNLLRDTRQDVRTLEWAQAANREGMVMYFGIKRAKEEICCLNVEICRLLTFLYDDYVNHYPPVYATFMYQYLVVTKLVDTCIVVVANQPKKPVKQGARRDAGVG